MNQSETHKKIIHRYAFEHYTLWRDELIEELIHPEVRGDFVGGFGTGLEEYRSWYREFKANFPDCTWIIECMVSEDDKVAVRWRYQATHAKTGKHICSTYSSFYTIRDNKIYLIQGDTDTQDIIKQLS